MSEYKILYRLRLGPTHQPTGRTRHVVGGQMAPVPAELQIVHYEGDAGYYLLYCDETGMQITDTYHDSVAAAMAQAKWEYNTAEREWESVGGN